MAVETAHERLYPRWKNGTGFSQSPVRLHLTTSSGSAIMTPAVLVATGLEQRSLKSHTASGLDVSLRSWAETLADDVIATQAYLRPEAAPRSKAILPGNERALALLDQWMCEPDELGSAWWEAFEAELKQYRLAFHEE